MSRRQTYFDVWKENLLDDGDLIECGRPFLRNVVPVIPKRYFKFRDRRDLEIFFLRVGGKTYKEIGEDFGLSSTRVMQIFNRACREIRLALRVWNRYVFDYG